MKKAWVATGLMSLLLIPAAGLTKPGDSHYLASASTAVPGNSGRATLEKAMKDVSGLLNRFKPTGAYITNKSVQNKGPKGVPRVSFTATKYVGPIPVTSATVRGDVHQKGITCKAPANPEGYRLELTLSDSDSLVTDNVSKLLLDICLVEQPDGKASIKATSTMIEGPNYGTIAGPAVKDLLKKQVGPLISAFQEHAKQYSAAIVSGDLTERFAVVLPAGTCEVTEPYDGITRAVSSSFPKDDDREIAL